MTDADGDRLQALCDRVRQLAEAVSEHTLAAAREQAESIIAQATAQAETDCQSRLAAVRARLERGRSRQLQDARLAARARTDACRWDELTGVLDEAERTITSMRDRDPQRYYAALVRFFEWARKQLSADELVVYLNAADASAFRTRLPESDWCLKLVADDVTAGISVTSLDGNVVVDHCIPRRRQRMDAELRLMADETLFGSEE